MSDALSIARERLLALEREQAGSNVQSSELHSVLDDLLSRIDTHEIDLKQRDIEIRKARAALRRREQLDAAKLQSDAVHTGITDRTRELYEKATQFVWADGIMEHQLYAAVFGTLATRWLCGDAPGLGKTREAIGWCDLIDAQRVIVITPARVASQFAGEFMDLAPHRDIVLLSGTSPEQRKAVLDDMLTKTAGVVVLNFETWRKDQSVLDKLVTWQADTVIVDEAHALRNARTRTSRDVTELIAASNLGESIKRPVSMSEILSTRSVKNVMFTTGTPILNAPTDLYPLLHILDPLLFRSENDFLATYCYLHRRTNRWRFRSGALKQLAPLLGGRYLARTKDDVGIVLPEQRQHTVVVELTEQSHPKQYRVIRQITETAEIVLESGASHTIMHALTLMMRKRQANVWPAGIEIRDPNTDEVLFSVGDEVQESAKLDALMAQIMECAGQGKRQVVFSHFKSALRELEQRLLDAGIRVVRFDGDTSPKLKQEVQDNFYKAKNEPAKWDVLLVNYRSGGVGLNLTACQIAHKLDDEWSPGMEGQATDRIYRIGQDQETDIYDYVIPKSIDTWMRSLKRGKQALVDGFTGTMAPVQQFSASSFLDALKSGEIL